MVRGTKLPSRADAETSRGNGEGSAAPGEHPEVVENVVIPATQLSNMEKLIRELAHGQQSLMKEVSHLKETRPLPEVSAPSGKNKGKAPRDTQPPTAAISSSSSSSHVAKQKTYKDKVDPVTQTGRSPERISVFDRMGNSSSSMQTVNTRPVTKNKAQPTGVAVAIHNELPQDIQDAMEKLKKYQSGVSSGPSGSKAVSSSPFAKEIETVTLHSKSKLPVMDKYDGVTDPEDYLYEFNQTMSLHGFCDELKCKFFSTHLRGVAATWFKQLPSSSINSFDQLTSLYLSHFSTNKKVERDYSYLYSIQQIKGESIKDYVRRFNQALLEVPNVTSIMAGAAAVHGVLIDTPFYFELSKMKNLTIEQFNEKAQEHIISERNFAARRGDSHKSGEKDEKANAVRGGEKVRQNEWRRGDRRGDRRFNSNEQRRPSFPPRYTELTKLVKPAHAVFYAVEKRGIIPRPPRTKNIQKGPNPNAYCDFHKDVGHSTASCYTLKNAIEDCIRKGWLREFVAPDPCNENQPWKKHKKDDDDNDKDKASGARPPTEDREKTERKCAGVIHTIIGGPPANNTRRTSGASSSRSGGKAIFHVERKKRKIDTIISFSDEDFEGVKTPHQDALVINANILASKHAFWRVERIMIDTGSSADILFNHCYEQLRPSLQQRLKPYDSYLYGFDNKPIQPRGVIKLLVQLGDGPHVAEEEIEFVVVDSFSPYNIIMGRNSIWAFEMIISMPHLKAKFLTPTGVGVCKGNQETAKNSYLQSLKGDRVCIIEPEDDSTPRIKPEPVEQLDTIQLDENPEHTTRIGTSMATDLKATLVQFLRDNCDVFAWSPSDMPGVDPNLITHELRVNKNQRPVRQKLRFMSPEKQAAIEDEVKKLLQAKFIKEEQYPTWLANVVMVKKSTGKWRMCVDYTDLNKACPKDCFPLPRIDQLVDSTSGHELLSFMDAFSGYNQIKMHPTDKVHTSFITAFGTYCYNVMPFGLKNAGATFQRMVTKVFQRQIGRNMEVYVDDMIVKSKLATGHLKDLEEAFNQMRSHGLKLNPQKSVFGAISGKFLGFLVSRRGIEANPDKIRAVLDMQAPTSVKDVQRLAGRVAALGRFVPRSADRCSEFFKLLRSPSQFQWTDQCQKAFEDLKLFLISPPVLSTPTPGEILYLYLAVSNYAVSSVLTRAEGRQHRPVYYVSHVLQDAETRYTKIEKFILIVVKTARRLRPYFDAHQVIVLSDLPLRSMLQSPETSGRMMKYALELSGYGIQFQPRDAIKAQFLADFLVEYTGTPDPKDDKKPVWTLHVDGSSTQTGSGAGLVLTGPHEVKISYALKFGFDASNNAAEYEALIAGLKLANAVGAECIEIFSDSMLVVQQLKGEYVAKEDGMIKYLQLVQSLVSKFSHWNINKIPRSDNIEADRLSKYASVAIPNPDKACERIFVEYLPQTSLDLQHKQVLPLETIDTHDPPSSSSAQPGIGNWMVPILDYLQHGILPDDRKEAKSLQYRAANFILIDGILYKRGLSFPYLRCLHPTEGMQILNSLHSGECSNHIQSQSLYVKALRLGYYWPTMRADAKDLVKKCEQCQKYAHIPRAPSSFLQCITSPWPFAQWGLDIIGPLRQSTNQKRNIIVACDYFTKWVEAEAVADVTEKRIRGFVYNNILSRFGVPHTLVMDNGKQFDCKGMRDFCQKYSIIPCYASVAHPQANGQVEAINKTIKESIKKRCDRFGRNWVEELPGILWGYRTTKRSSTEETPFRLAFGTEAVLPIELELPNIRTQSYDQLVNQIGLRAHLDVMDETADEVRHRIAAYQHRAERYYNKRVQPRTFLPGDLVCRRLEAARPSDARGALAPNWEDPVRVSIALGNGAYKLETLDGEPIPRTWNANDLRKFFE